MSASAEIIKQNQELLKSAIQIAVRDALKTIKLTKEDISDELFLELLNMASTTANISLPMGDTNIPQSRADECQVSFQIDKQIASIITDLKLGNNVYLYGLAGTGKTYTAEKVAELLGIRSYTINCSQWTSPTIIVGGQTIEGYKKGQLELAWKEGGLLILDELPKLDPNTAGLLNDALSKTGNRPDVCEISKETYEKGRAMGEQVKTAYFKGKEAIDFYDDAQANKYYKITFPTITSGSGEVLRKNKNFCVIASGNTDMMNPTANFGGNNKQDYSLVDRFAGSYYEVSFNEQLEMSLTYQVVFLICRAIREILIQDRTIEQAITLRTMLNFNRIYENQMLKILGVKEFGYKGVEVNGIGILVKTLKESFDAFIMLLPDTPKNAIISDATIESYVKSAIGRDFQQTFMFDFLRLHGITLWEAPYNKQKPNDNFKNIIPNQMINK